jgi:hypothetical protein
MFGLDTDASLTGISGILWQKHDGQEYPLAFWSRTLSDAERNYSNPERECLALVAAVKHYREYLFGTRFLARVDCSALTWLHRFKETTPKLLRWSLQLQSYTFDVEHRPGSQHVVPDALSRVDAGAINVMKQNPIWQGQGHMEGEKFVHMLQLPGLQEDQNADEHLQPLLQKYGTPVGDLLELTRDSDGVYWVKGRLVLPQSRVREVLRVTHDSPMGGHLGYEKTKEKIRARFFWPGMLTDIRRWVDACLVCKTRKLGSGAAKVSKQHMDVEEPFVMWSVDTAGPLPETLEGNRFYVAFMEHFTRWVEVFPCASDPDPKLVADLLLNQIFSRFGAPGVLLSDRGKEYLNQVVEAVCNLLTIKQKFAASYNPQCNGKSERFNRTFKGMLKMFCEEYQSDWDEYIPLILFAYRDTPNALTHFSPAEMVYGRRLRYPNDLYAVPTKELDEVEYVQKLRDRLAEVGDVVKTWVQKGRLEEKRTLTPSFDPGDRVWLRLQKLNSKKKRKLSTKLARKWTGPFWVSRRVGLSTYYLLGAHGKEFPDPVNQRRLKKATGLISDEMVEIPAEKLSPRQLVGRKIRVYLEGTREWRYGWVTSYNGRTKRHHVKYSDGVETDEVLTTPKASLWEIAKEAMEIEGSEPVQLEPMGPETEIYDVEDSKVGELIDVMVTWQGRKRYREGKLLAKNPNGTYVIQYTKMGDKYLGLSEGGEQSQVELRRGHVGFVPWRRAK